MLCFFRFCVLLVLTLTDSWVFFFLGLRLWPRHVQAFRPAATRSFANAVAAKEMDWAAIAETVETPEGKSELMGLRASYMDIMDKATPKVIGRTYALSLHITRSPLAWLCDGYVYRYSLFRGHEARYCLVQVFVLELVVYDGCDSL